MRKRLISHCFLLIFAITSPAPAGEKPGRNEFYINNRPPLVAQPYAALPLGAIQPKGWLRKMLKIQRDGLTGNLDLVYEKVCGERNGWLGGDGDGWERGPYWIDGLVPLGYILGDEGLIEKARRWISWSIENQAEDGYFGPVPFKKEPEKEPGVQRGKRRDWWPKMVMLKALQQYYTATGDRAVLRLMDRYFRYQLKMLPTTPLGHWTFWAERRGGDNLQLVYWLYNVTGEKYLLELADLIHKQTFNWAKVFSDNTIRNLNPFPHLHCVNVAMGLKEPVIYYQQHPEQKYLDAVKEGLTALRDVHGFVNGMYGGDENLHGNDPTQGSELCSAVEMMYSFESILPITGDVYYADYLEKVAYNVLPTQHSDDFTRRQYFQQINQVLVTDHTRNFDIDEKSRIVFGVLTGYPCCTANMHQGWPKLVQNLWYATADNGVAALIYGASEVKVKVAGGKIVKFIEDTDYPFSDKILFKYRSAEKLEFPLHLRIPGWCDEASVKINGKTYKKYAGGRIVKINRKWKDKDELQLSLPMKVKTSRWYEKSLGLERGPLVYALKIGEKWREVKTGEFESSYYEVLPTDPWNYGLLEKSVAEKDFTIKIKETVAAMPWNLANAPIEIRIKAKRMMGWGMYNHSAGKIPVQRWPARKEPTPVEVITLIPYGCTTLRVAQFPLTN